MILEGDVTACPHDLVGVDAVVVDVSAAEAADFSRSDAEVCTGGGDMGELKNFVC